MSKDKEEATARREEGHNHDRIKSHTHQVKFIHVYLFASFLNIIIQFSHIDVSDSL